MAFVGDDFNISSIRVENRRVKKGKAVLGPLWPIRPVLRRLES